MEETTNISDALKAFNHILPSAKLNISETIKRIKKSKKFVPIKLMDDLNWRDFAKLNSNIHKLKGVYPVVGFKRYIIQSQILTLTSLGMFLPLMKRSFIPTLLQNLIMLNQER